MADVIRQRKHDKVFYLAGHDVERRLSEVFGATGWNQEVVRAELISTATRAGKAGDVHVACYRVVVRIEVPELGLVRDGVSCTCGQPSKWPEEAHDMGLKSAATDALKRAAKTLGNSLGLALYADPEEALAEGYVTREEPRAKGDAGAGQAMGAPQQPPGAEAGSNPAAAPPASPPPRGDPDPVGTAADQAWRSPDLRREADQRDDAWGAAWAAILSHGPADLVSSAAKEAVVKVVRGAGGSLVDLYARANLGEAPDPRRTTAWNLARVLLAADPAWAEAMLYREGVREADLRRQLGLGPAGDLR